MARKLVFYWVRLGYSVCIISSAAVLFFNVLFAVFPWNMTIIMVIYFLFLSAIWLSVTIMYILQKELTFTGLIIGGIFLVFLFFKLLNLNIILSQVTSLLIISVAGIIIAQYYFVTTEKQKEKGINPPMPRLSVIFHISIPYFVYGSLYFLLLFIDRIIAWSTNSVYMPFFIWFRGEYELGLDLALIVMILPMGLVEAIVTELMADLESSQKNYMAVEAGRMNEKYTKMYIKRMAYVVGFSLVNALGMYLAVAMIGKGGALATGIIFSATSRFVFNWALIAYAIVGLPLMNSLVLFCLARPEMAYRPVIYACGTNTIIGFMLSRWIDHKWAVAGLLAGSLVFAFFSSRQVIKLFRNLDYYLYAAL